MWNIRFLALLLFCAISAHVALSLPIQIPKNPQSPTSELHIVANEPARRAPGRKKGPSVPNAPPTPAQSTPIKNKQVGLNKGQKPPTKTQTGPKPPQNAPTPARQGLPKLHKNDDPNNPKTAFEPVPDFVRYRYKNEAGDTQWVSSQEVNDAASRELPKLNQPKQSGLPGAYPETGSGFRTLDNDSTDPAPKVKEGTTGVSYHFPIDYSSTRPNGDPAPGVARIVAHVPPSPSNGAPNTKYSLTPTYHDYQRKPVPSAIPQAPGTAKTPGRAASSPGFSLKEQIPSGPLKPNGDYWRRHLYRIFEPTVAH